jgi:formylglycine-generating enzyme required for sulfatase activity
VEQVSWNDCQEFIRKLNAKIGGRGKFRLPTDAEWEYAARGGSRSRGYKYAGGNDIGTVAWYDDNSGDKTHPVGQKQANELGIYDMSGNVWEWCQDWYDSGYYGKSSGSDPVNLSKASDRVLRGGSWGRSAGLVRVAYRDGYTPTSTGSGLGFRLCLARSQ